MNTPKKHGSKPSKGSKFTFQVWAGDNNLASINSDCLAVMVIIYTFFFEFLYKDIQCISYVPR